MVNCELRMVNDAGSPFTIDYSPFTIQSARIDKKMSMLFCKTLTCRRKRGGVSDSCPIEAGLFWVGGRAAPGRGQVMIFCRLILG